MIEHSSYSYCRGMSQTSGPSDGLFQDLKLKLQRVRNLKSEVSEMSEQMMSELEGCDRESSASDSSTSADSAYVSDRTSDFDNIPPATKKARYGDDVKMDIKTIKRGEEDEENFAGSGSNSNGSSSSSSGGGGETSISEPIVTTSTCSESISINSKASPSQNHISMTSSASENPPVLTSTYASQAYGSSQVYTLSQQQAYPLPQQAYHPAPSSHLSTPPESLSTSSPLNLSPRATYTTCTTTASTSVFPSEGHKVKSFSGEELTSSLTSSSSKTASSLSSSQAAETSATSSAGDNGGSGPRHQSPSPVSPSLKSASPTMSSSSTSSPMTSSSPSVITGSPMVLSCPPGYLMQFPGPPPPGMKIFPVISLANTSMFQQVPTSVFLASTSSYLMSTNTTFTNGDKSIITYPTLDGPKVLRSEDVFKLDKSQVFIQSHMVPDLIPKETPANKKDTSAASRLEKDTEFISHYTNGAFVYRGHLAENPHNLKPRNNEESQNIKSEDSDGEEPLVCAICNDRATGLHYGIITCEGCKGFFKRTVQNKRVYACVADSDCEINKAQRNRCQYCRFKKCLKMGMVLAAVREDRMPGGRNSGAVYNLCKVKYKKLKRRDSDKSLRQPRLPTCKLETSDLIQGYSTSTSADSAYDSGTTYDSSTDVASDTGSSGSLFRSYSYPFYPNRLAPGSENQGSDTSEVNKLSGFDFYQKPPTASYSSSPRSFTERSSQSHMIPSSRDNPSPSVSSPYPPYPPQSQGNSADVSFSPHLSSKSCGHSPSPGYHSPRHQSGNPYYFMDRPASSTYHKFSSSDANSSNSHADHRISQQNQSHNYSHADCDTCLTSPRDIPIVTRDVESGRDFDSPRSDWSQVKQEYESDNMLRTGKQVFRSNSYPRTDKSSKEISVPQYTGGSDSPHHFYGKPSLKRTHQDNHRIVGQTLRQHEWQHSDLRSSPLTHQEAQPSSSYQSPSHQPSSSMNSPYPAPPQPYVKPLQQIPQAKKRSASDDLFKNPLPVTLNRSSLSIYASPAKLLADLARNDCLLTIAEDYHIDQFTGSEDTVAQALCQVGDNIVMRFVKWMKHLPFYREIPKELQTEILMSKWHELLLLLMTAHGPANKPGAKKNGMKPGFTDLYASNMNRMQEYLQKSFGKFFTMEQLNSEIGPLMEKVTRIMAYFWQLGLTRKELLCLMVILLLSHDGVRKERMLHHITMSYRQALQQYILEHFPSEANRLGDLLSQFSNIKNASAQLLASKMIYIPFLLNS